MIRKGRCGEAAETCRRRGAKRLRSQAASHDERRRGRRPNPRARVSRLDGDLEEARAALWTRSEAEGQSGASRRRSITCFRRPRRGVRRRRRRTASPLLEGALVGARRAHHLVSVDFTGDLMEVFRKLLAKEDAPLAADQKARCLLAACDMLSGHGEALQVDLGEFHRQMYRMLLQARVPRRRLIREACGSRRAAVGPPPPPSPPPRGATVASGRFTRFLGAGRAT